MKSLFVIGAVFIGLGAHAAIRQLPSFFKTCKANDPKLNDCIIEKSKETLPGILKGVKDFKIPSFLPLKLKEVKVDAGNVILKLTDFDMYGLDSTVLTKVDLDLEKRKSIATLEIAQLQINGTYDVDGKILVLPIKGHGPGYLQFDELTVAVEFSYDLIEMPEDKKYHFIKLISLKVDYTLKKAFFKFDNLFNGDKTLGDEMNTFLNENWPEFNKDLSPAIISVIETVVRQITKGILEMVPVENMWPE